MGRFTIYCLLLVVSVHTYRGVRIPLADERPGVVAVQVLDRNEFPFAGIKVVLRPNTRTGSPQETLTNNRGIASFDGLVIGSEYTLMVEPEVGFLVETSAKATYRSTPQERIRLLDLRADVPARARDVTPEEEEISIAVLKHQVAKFERGTSSPSDVYYIGLLGKDPTPEFLRQLRVEGIDAKPGSRFRQGGRRVSLDIYYFLPLEEDIFEVGGGYYMGLLAAGGHTYTVQKDDSGNWRVVRDVENWIS